MNYYQTNTMFMFNRHKKSEISVFPFYLYITPSSPDLFNNKQNYNLLTYLVTYLHTLCHFVIVAQKFISILNSPEIRLKFD
jgi:hypothetical protein